MQEQGTLQLDVVKPDGALVSQAVEECILPGALGSFGVRPGHAPLLTLLGTGELMYRIGGERRYLAIAGGFCEVRPDRVTVLAETAERGEQIDVARAERARTRAAEHLAAVSSRPTVAAEIEAVAATLHRAELRLAVAAKAQGGGAATGSGVSPPG